MRAGPYNLELDKENLRLYASSGSQIHPSGMDHPSRLSALSRAETVSGTLGFGASRSLQLTGPTSPFSFGLHGLFAPGQLEAIPPSPQAPSYWQVFGCHRLAVAVT
jgi:hypothetical protein